ncbi:MAG: 1-acyl-sn-glycerol-3-phosphate acyltransferase [Paludibacteraceae bacterium]|nr:1-acyl-sn-glycerol-3-phosphate acyltransferase [Paludibacteraceae bacterium]
MSENVANTSKKKVDIDAILESKAPALKKKLPNFVISYLKKTIHQDELNEIFTTDKDKLGNEFTGSNMKRFNWTLKIEGEENLPEDGRVIFASNHPLGGADGVVLLDFLSRRYKEVKAPVNDLLMHVENMRNFFIPINKLGSQTKEASIEINHAYESDTTILYFPAGMCSRRQPNGEIKDMDWKKAFIVNAVKHQRDIVPLHFIGHNSKFFYNLAYYRTKLGIKANIEMLYLVDELFKSKNTTFTARIGKPIPWQTFTQEKTPLQWAAYIKDIVYNL